MQVHLPFALVFAIGYWCLNCNLAARSGRPRIVNHKVLYATWVLVLLVWHVSIIGLAVRLQT